MILNSLETALAQAFTRATLDPNNLLADGSVIWDYVDADLCIEYDNVVKQIGPGRYNELFNYLADAHDADAALMEGL